MEKNAVMELKDAMDKKFAKDIIVMDLGGVSPIADFFVIATASNSPQMAALTDAAEECLKSHSMTLYHTEGLQSGRWVLLDFGAVIVHIFDKESREYYNLERIWGDAKVV